MGEEFNSFKRLSNLIQFIIRTGDSRFSELNRELRKTMPAESIWNSALINYRDAVGVHYEFHDSLMEVAGLIHECERDIEGWKSVDREGQLAFQELLDTVKAAIFEVNGRSWEEFREKFNDPFLTALRIAAHDMSHYQSEEEIEEGTLQDLQIEIEEIIEKKQGAQTHRAPPQPGCSVHRCMRILSSRFDDAVRLDGAAMCVEHDVHPEDWNQDPDRSIGLVGQIDQATVIRA